MSKEQLAGTIPEEKFWELALATNAAFKGLLGFFGQSGHICQKTYPLEVHLSVQEGWERVQRLILESLRRRVRHGDVIVIADKIVAASLGRVGPRAVLESPDPKTVSAARLPALAATWEKRLEFMITAKHLMLADQYGEDQATLGSDDPNARAAELASLFPEVLDTHVDVIISDTDTGLDTRTPLIDMVTIAATPIGATAGVNLYEAMRCAVAAEFTRGHDRGVPVVLCRPAQRRRNRDRIGLYRGYSGLLSRHQEDHIAHA